MRNRLNTIDELLATTGHRTATAGSGGGATRDRDDDLLMSASDYRAQREKAVHVHLRSKALLVSSTASCVASMLFLWAWWAVFRLRKALGVVVAGTLESGSDLAGFDCATGASEEGTCLDSGEDSLVLALESGVGVPWKEESQENWAPMPSPAAVSKCAETLDSIGEQRPQRDGDAGACFATPEPSPPTSNALIHHSVRDARGTTTPVLPTERTVMFGNAGVNCNLCGYTLGEGDEVVRAPACGEGFMVRKSIYRKYSFVYRVQSIYRAKLVCVRTQTARATQHPCTARVGLLRSTLD